MKTFNDSQSKRNADGKHVFLYYQEKNTSKSIPQVYIYLNISFLVKFVPKGMYYCGLLKKNRVFTHLVRWETVFTSSNETIILSIQFFKISFI